MKKYKFDFVTSNREPVRPKIIEIEPQDILVLRLKNPITREQAFRMKERFKNGVKKAANVNGVIVLDDDIILLYLYSRYSIFEQLFIMCSELYHLQFLHLVLFYKSRNL